MIERELCWFHFTQYIQVFENTQYILVQTDVKTNSAHDEKKGAPQAKKKQHKSKPVLTPRRSKPAGDTILG